MLPFDLPICPCCTGAMLHAIAQNAAEVTAAKSLLYLGKGNLLAALRESEQKSPSMAGLLKTTAPMSDV